MSYNSDKPVVNKDDDYFRRYDFSKRIADSIKNINHKDCIVFGINGAWGEGKTTVLNFIEEELKRDSPRIICLRFNPWMYENEKSLLISLFNSIAVAIDKAFPKKQRRFFITKDEDSALRTEAEEIGSLLTKYGNGIIGVVGKGLENNDVEDLKNRIEKSLEKLKSRVVVFIDDIDRLDKDEIYSILRIVKLTGGFKNTTYILSFDEEMVASAIGERFGEGGMKAGENFLEKIIQVPLKIPKIQRVLLKKFTLKLINNTLNDARINLSEKEFQRFTHTFFDYLLPKVKTPRLALRYTNSIKFLLPLLKGEVNYVDLMLMEGVKILYPGFYFLVKNESHYFLENYYNGFEENVDSEKVEEIQSKLDLLSSNLLEIESLNVIQLLKELFPVLYQINGGNFIEDSRAYVRKRISHHKYFDRYFSYSIIEGDISDEEFVRAVRNESFDYVRLSKKLENLILRSNIDNFIFKVREYKNFFTSKENERLVKAISIIGEMFSDELIEFNDFFQHATQRAEITSLIYDIILQNKDGARNLEIFKFIIKESKPFGFAMEVYERVSGNNQDNLRPREEMMELPQLIIERAKFESEDIPFFLKFKELGALLIGIWKEIDKEYGTNELEKYINKTIRGNYLYVLDLIESYAPRSTNTPSRHRGNISIVIYQWMKNNLNVDFIYEIIKKVIPDMDLSKESFKRKIPNTQENMAKQFVELHLKDKEL